MTNDGRNKTEEFPRLVGTINGKRRRRVLRLPIVTLEIRLPPNHGRKIYSAHFSSNIIPTKLPRPAVRIIDTSLHLREV